MAAVFHDESKPDVLNAYMAAAEAYLEVRLFKNDFTPTRSATLGGFTEGNFSGYDGQALDYPAADLDDDDEGSSIPGPVTFTHDGGATPNTIYGWYLVNTSTGRVVFSKRFGSPISMAEEGDYIAVVLPVKVREVA